MKIRGFKVAKGYEDKNIKLPERKTKYSAGYDVESAIDIVIKPYTKEEKPVLIPTGIKSYFLQDEYLMLVNRSSGPKKGYLKANGIGIIDSDYYENISNDGEIFFQYINISDKDLVIKKGDVIGQAIFQKFLISDQDNAENNRVGGFGSTDKK